MPKYTGPSRAQMKAGKSTKPKIAAPKGTAKKPESLGQFKSRTAKMSRDELLKEAEDILGDESI